MPETRRTGQEIQSEILDSADIEERQGTDWRREIRGQAF